MAIILIVWGLHKGLFSLNSFLKKQQDPQSAPIDYIYL